MIMLTQDQILEEISRLPKKEQRNLLVHLIEAMHHGEGDFEGDTFRGKLSREDRIAIARSLSGTFKPESRYMPMTKEEDREIIMEYLEEKYR